MILRFGTGVVATGFVLGFAATGATAAKLPAIDAASAGPVPECVTPGRLMAFIRDRNPRLSDRYSDISVQYMRIGQDLGVRWDYAFYQMLVETGSLTYKGDVKPQQNNFAGIGATGGGARGESFPTVAEGVRAHLEHLLIYAGRQVDNPVSERTRKVQSWGILDTWRQRFGGRPVRFNDMTRKWSPGDRGYARDIQSVADSFMRTRCGDVDPQPGLVAGIRTTGDRAAGTQVASAGTGAEFAKQAVERARQQGATRSSLGSPVQDTAKKAQQSLTQSVSVINAGSNEIAPAANAGAQESRPSSERVASAGTSVGRFASNLIGSVRPPAKSSADPDQCRVWTASYGGQNALIIRSISKSHVNYTVLDVNTGREDREADAYIAAYAKGGETIGKYTDPTKALKKAFELCPDSAAK